MRDYWKAYTDVTQLFKDCTGDTLLDWPDDHLCAYMKAKHALRVTYAFTLDDPKTFDWVSNQLKGLKVVDPMAGSGYWGRELQRVGIDIDLYDLHGPETNGWYKKKPLADITFGMLGSESVREKPYDVLLLAWPPYDSSAGCDTLRAFKGDRVLYMGEGVGGCCGDYDMFALLDSEWRRLSGHKPEQWEGIHDRCSIWERL